LDQGCQGSSKTLDSNEIEFSGSFRPAPVARDRQRRIARVPPAAKGKHSTMSEQNVVDDVSQQQVFADDFDGNFDSGDSDFESSSNGQPGPGMGQSKSSRRRRRKRKNKLGSDSPAPAAEGAAAQQTIIMEGESLALAGSGSFAAQPPQPRKPQLQQTGGQPQGQPGQGQGQGKRWKKKFRDRERRGRDGGDSRPEPGNEATGGGGGGYRERDRGGRPDNFGNLAGGYKGKKQGGQKDRGFVGPMDHSYRSESPDFNGAPPSTINLHGAQGRRNGRRHYGDAQPIDHSMPRPIPIPENAQTHIYFFIEELFLIAKIQETARKQGIKVSFVKNDKDSVAEMLANEETDRPYLIVFDLNNANAKPLTTIPKLKTKLKRGTSIIGFLSHLQGDLKAKAMESGCDVVMPRAAFSQNLPNLLRRYGVEEEDDVNYNY
jgi:hypothetical protein